MYLGGLAAEEIKSGARVEFKKWCGRGADFRRTWKDEMLRYSQRQYPYNVPIDESQPFAVIRWFEKIIAGDLTGGQLLPVRLSFCRNLGSQNLVLAHCNQSLFRSG